jgi:hypothetical protein
VSEATQYCFVTEDGEWSSGPFDSIEEALRVQDVDERLCTLRKLDVADYLPDLETLCEMICDAADDVAFEECPTVRDEAAALEEFRAWARKWIRLEFDQVAGDLVTPRAQAEVGE